MRKGFPDSNCFKNVKSVQPLRLCMSCLICFGRADAISLARPSCNASGWDSSRRLPREARSSAFQLAKEKGFEGIIAKRKTSVQWVRPELVCEVAFASGGSLIE